MKNFLKKIVITFMALAMFFGIIYSIPTTASAGGSIILPIVPIEVQTQDMNYRTYLSKLASGTKLVKAYDAIYEGVKNSSATISVEAYNITIDQLNMVVNALSDNAPELFWFVGGGTTSYKSGNIAVTYTPSYLFTGTDLETAKTKFNNAVEDILSTIDKSASEYEKEKAVHDYLITHTTYDVEASYNQSAYSAIVNGHSVCAGYGKSFLLLTRKLGMKCLYIIGAAVQSSSTENHGWNMIEIDDEYYMVDTTWDDARESVPNDVVEHDDIAAVGYNYFNVTSAYFDLNHNKGLIYNSNTKTLTASKREYYSEMPTACTATEANYFEVNKDKLLYVKSGAASDITVADVVKMLTNPLDDACRIYIENTADVSAVKTKIGNLLNSVYTTMGLSGATKSGGTSLTFGHEMIYYYLLAPVVNVHGDVKCADNTKSATIWIKNSSGTEVYRDVVSGLGASYAAYGLASGNYTFYYQLEGGSEQYKKVSIIGTNTPINNVLEVDIDLTKSVKSIEVSSLPKKTNYLVGKDALNLAGGKLKVTYTDDSTETIDLSDADVTGFDNSKVGKNTLTATYNGKTANFDVTINEKSLSGISIKSAPTKLTYLEGKETLNVSGGKITLSYNNGTSEDIDMTASMVSGFDNTKVGKQTLTVTYGGFETSFDVTITAKSLTGIAMKAAPDKLTYLEAKDTLVVTGGKITLSYDNGTSGELDITAAMVSGFDNTKTGKQTLTVTYGGFQTSFDVTITAKSLSGISIKSTPDKVTYLEGKDELSVAGGKITLSYNNGTSEDIDMTASMVSGFDNTKVGKQTLTVTYGGFETNFDVTITAKSLTGISMKQNPAKLIYLVSMDELDVTGGKITLSYDNGTSGELDITAGMVTGFDNATPGKQTLTVTYSGFKTTFDITVSDKTLTGIAIKSAPDKLTYLEGKDALSVTGGKITLNYDNGTSDELDITAAMVSGFDNTKLGKQTLTVTYNGKTTTFDITVTAKSLSGISMKQNPTKLTYLVAMDALDVTGGKITLVYDNGTSGEMDITAAMVTGFDNATPGKQTLTVTYGGFQTSFDVTIIAKSLTGIAIKSAPGKLTYLEGKDALSVTGGKITLSYDNGTSEDIDITAGMVSGFNNSTPGKQTLTVTYGGFKAYFDVTITAKSLVEITIHTLPKKVEYTAFKEELDLDGGVIKLFYDNDTTDFISLSEADVTGFDNGKPGEQTLTATYEGKSATFVVNIVNNLPIEQIFKNEETQVRSKGASRYDTACVTANNLKTALSTNEFGTIIIACGTNFPDALAGSYLAAKKSAPILIVGGGASAAGAADAINYVKDNLASGGTVYILGGTGAVAQSVEDGLKALKSASFTLTVTRLKDTDRYGTNMKILAEAGLDDIDTLLICDGAGFADALSASALGLPILLINKKTGTLTQAQKDYIAAGGFSKIYILGGTGAVPESIKTDVQGVSTATITRLSGKGRYETSVAIAKEFFTDTECITIATGVNFPDGLTGGSLSYALKAPLILTTNTEAAITLANGFVQEKGVDKILTFGGTAAIKDETVSSIMAK